MRKYVIGLIVFALAFGILSVSVLRSSSISYVFAVSPSPTPTTTQTIKVDYQFLYPGKILPDSPLWVFKAGRDMLWFYISVNPAKKAELALMFSDKRLLFAKELFENKKPDIAISTLTKGEKYLEIAQNQEAIARAKGQDTTAFLLKLATASLKHREMIEEMLPLAPEDARPELVKIENYSKDAYKSARDTLNSKGVTAPKDPFDGH